MFKKGELVLYNQNWFHEDLKDVVVTVSEKIDSNFYIVIMNNKKIQVHKNYLTQIDND